MVPLSLLFVFPAFAQLGAECVDCAICTGEEVATYAGSLTLFLFLLCCCFGTTRKARGAKPAGCIFFVFAVIFGSFLGACLNLGQSQEFAWLITTIVFTAVGLCAICCWCAIKASDDEEDDVCNRRFVTGTFCVLAFLVLASTLLGLRTKGPIFSGGAVCTAGSYLEGFKCQDCPSGFYCPGNNNKIACPAGTFASVTGQKTQRDCGVCRAGYYCPEGSSSSMAVICPVGSYCSSGAAKPTLCPAGRYGAVKGLSTSSCSGICAGGTFSVAGQERCTTCPYVGGNICGGFTCASTGCVCPAIGKWNFDCSDCAEGYWGISCNRQCDGGVDNNCFGGVCSSGIRGNGTCSCPDGTCAVHLSSACGAAEWGLYVALLVVFACMMVGCCLAACKQDADVYEQNRSVILLVACMFLCLTAVTATTLTLCDLNDQSQELIWVLSGIVITFAFFVVVSACYCGCKGEIQASVRKVVRLCLGMIFCLVLVFGIMMPLYPVFDTTRCAPGSFPSDSRVCEICPKGYYCETGAEKVRCMSGVYGNGLGLTSPTCSASCPAGSYCIEGTSIPEVCPMGHYCPYHSAAPIACPPYTYGAQEGLMTASCSGSCVYATRPGAEFCSPALSNPPTSLPSKTPSPRYPTSPSSPFQSPTSPPFNFPTSPSFPSPTPSTPFSSPPSSFIVDDLDNLPLSHEKMLIVVIVLVSLLFVVCLFGIVLYCHQNRKFKKLSAQALNENLLHVRDREEEKKHQSVVLEEYIPPPLPPFAPSAPSAPLPPAYDDSCAPSAPPPPLPAEEKTCVICLEAFPTTAFLPCGHKVCCEECANQITQCPICRRQIANRARIYESY